MAKRKMDPADDTPKKVKTNEKKKQKVAANGYKHAVNLPAGEILKKKWKLGKSIGQGGFGMIYLASSEPTKLVDSNAPYVIKIEPQSNGPLFTEVNFYLRAANADNIKNWTKTKKLDFLGMPPFIESGLHEYNSVSLRFLVMGRYGEDLQKIFERNNRQFPVKTVFTLAKRIMDVLEYIHSTGYIHADVKAANLLLGNKNKDKEVYLVDFGLATKYKNDKGHKECKPDKKRAHNGTIEFTSRDAHLGMQTRRSDLEILGYNLLQWLCKKLPWENNLKDVNYVSDQKNKFMSDVPKQVGACFPNKPSPPGIEEYFKYVATLKPEQEPDYSLCRDIFHKAIVKSGAKDDNKFDFGSQKASATVFDSPKVSKVLKTKRSNTPKDKIPRVTKSTSPNENLSKVTKPKVRKEAKKVVKAKVMKEKQIVEEPSTSQVSNPTPAMLLIMNKAKTAPIKKKVIKKVANKEEEDKPKRVP